MIEERIKSKISDILGIKKEELTTETDLIRELDAESIDMLEIAISLEKEFGIKIDENSLFLKAFRYYLEEAHEKNTEEVSYLKQKFPFLDEKRIRELIDEAKSNIVPSIKIKDLICYVQWAINRNYQEKKEHKEI